MIRIKKIEKNVLRIRRSLKKRRLDGGPGSGNWGHEGRPGKVGGSGEGGGKHNRKVNSKGFTSFSRRRKESMTPHPLGMHEIITASRSADVLILDGDGNRFTVHDMKERTFICKETGEIRKFQPGQTARVLLPNRLNTNYKVTRDDKTAMSVTMGTFKRADVAENGLEADNRYRANAAKVWQGCTDQQKSDLFEYTSSGHRKINSALRGGEADDYYVAQKVNNITEVLDKSVIPKDSIFFRGISKRAAEKMFGLPGGYLSDQHEENMSMVGRIGTDNGFMSCGAARGTGFEDDVRLEIFAPAGTKGLYCEPFSAHGLGSGMGWNGKASQDDFSNECEMLLQRGCTVQVIGHDITEDESGKRIHTLRVAIVRQEPGEFKYTGG